MSLCAQQINLEKDMQGESKRTINMLMNVNNYFGEHEKRLMPLIVFLLISAAPVLLYTFVLQFYISLKVLCVFEVLWIARMALFILGKENEKLVQFEIEQNSIYATADSLIQISNVNPDGLIEYTTGQVAYIISGYFMDYVDEESLNIDIQNFLRQLRGYDYDIYSHMVIDEYRCQNHFEGLKVYTEKEAVQQRMLFYQDQDEYASRNSEAFRISILVKGSRYAWKTMKVFLEKLVCSEYAECWKEIELCDEEMVNDIMSRDICMDVDVFDMLVRKYNNNNYEGSKVLFYGDNVPEEYRQHSESVGLSKRRVVERRQNND